MHARGIFGTALVAGALIAGTLIATDAGPAQADCGEPCGELDSRSANVQVEVLVGGRPAVVYRDGPYRWIEGRSGQQFAFRIVNRNRFPVGVIPSADGQSLTSDGRAGAKDPAYVIGPYDSLTVSVWREDLRGGRERCDDLLRSVRANDDRRAPIPLLAVGVHPELTQCH